jgi:hypothetical protein
MNFNDMYNAPDQVGGMTPDQLRAMVLKRAMGVGLTSAPIVPTPVATMPITPPQVPTTVVPPTGGPPTDPTAPPFRLDRGVVPPPDPTVAAVPPVPPVPPPRFGGGSTPPYLPSTLSTTPAPGGGVTLASNPIDPNAGWAASVGAAPNTEVAKAFDKGKDYSDTLNALGDIAKGLKPKSSADAAKAAATIDPTGVQAHQPSDLASSLMAQMIQAQRNRGLTLTGRS